MSIARPLSGIEVKTAIHNAILELERQMELEGADLAAEALSYLAGFSSLEGEHLVYPHVGWTLEGTIEREPAKFGAKSAVWASITMDLDLGGGALISKRFGEAAPVGVELITQLFPLQQRPMRTPDTLRERWLGEGPKAPMEDAPPSPPKAETSSSAPPPEAWNFVPDSLEDAPSPVGELPTLDAVDSEPEELEPETPSPLPKPKSAAKPRAKRGGR